jgi:hypothetical protein
MAATIAELAAQAMSLPTEVWAQPADLLVAGLAADAPGPIDLGWLAKAKRRCAEVRSGRVQPIPGDEALLAVRDARSECGGGSIPTRSRNIRRRATTPSVHQHEPLRFVELLKT